MLTKLSNSKFLIPIMAVVVISATGLGFYISLKQSQNQLEQNTATQDLFWPNPKQINDFNSKDHDNKDFGLKQMSGKWSFVFFGYTNCPDICPMTLNKMDIAISKLKKENKSLKLFFISVDPERDKPEVLKDYLDSFENNFVGITGEPEEIYLLSQSWGILSQKIFNETGEYNVDHSSPVILLKDGKYVARISHKDDIKRSIKIIKKYL